MSMRPTDERDYIRETARSRASAQSRETAPDADTTRIVTMDGGSGQALPPAGTMSRELSQILGYFSRRLFNILLFPYGVGRRIGGGLR